MDQPQKHKEQQESGKNSISLLAVAASVMAAFFGVQSKQNKERDFTQGSHKIFIIGGAIFTLLFIATLVIIVQLVIG